MRCSESFAMCYVFFTRLDCLAWGPSVGSLRHKSQLDTVGLKSALIAPLPYMPSGSMQNKQPHKQTFCGCAILITLESALGLPQLQNCRPLENN